MKIAIHHRQGSFSERWLVYCEEQQIPYKLVDCYSSDIMRELEGCAGLMWHWHHEDYREQNFARQLIYSLELRGMKVFPNFASCWHFDDKIGQKYLLEAIGGDLVPTYVFYDKAGADTWIDSASFPKVWKLRGGAGAMNVKLVKDKAQAKRLAKRAFGRGFPLIDRKSDLRQRLWILRRDRDAKSFVLFAKGIARFFVPRKGFALLPLQKGYAYFQDFIPGNDYDDRIVVVGDKAIAIRRNNRKGDFRASGSGLIEYDPALFEPRAVAKAFEIARKLKTQSLAFDFLYDESGTPKLTEISYCYAQGKVYDDCPGYWDRGLAWHEAPVNLQRFIIEDFLRSIEQECLNG